MAIINPQPPIVDGVSYPFLGFSLALATHIDNAPSGPYMEVSICCKMYSYREDENGVALLNLTTETDAGEVNIVYPRALGAATEGDVAIAKFLAEVQAAAQEYVNARV